MIGLGSNNIRNILDIPNLRNFWCADFPAGLNNPIYSDGTLLNGTSGKIINLGSGGSNCNLYHRNNRNEAHSFNTLPDNFSETSPPTFVGSGGLNNKPYFSFIGKQFVVQEAFNPSTEIEFKNRIFDYSSGETTTFFLVETATLENSNVTFSFPFEINSTALAFPFYLSLGNTIRHPNLNFYIPNVLTSENPYKGVSSPAHHTRRYKLCVEIKTMSYVKYYVSSDGFSLNPRTFTYSSSTMNLDSGSVTYQVFLTIGSRTQNTSYWDASIGQNMKWYCGGIFERAITEKEVAKLFNCLKRHYNI